MKKLLVIAILMVFGISVNELSAEDKKGKMVKAVFSTEIHCGSCKARIMDNAASLGSGVRSVEVSVEENTVTVVYDSKRIDEKEIIKNLKKLKFKAKLVKKEAVVSKKKKK